MARRTSPKWTEERGSMVLAMFGITVTLLGVAGVLLHLLGRPPAAEPVAAGRDAAMTAALAVRDQAVRTGLRAGDLDSPGEVDVSAACARAGRAAGAVQVVSCGLTPAGLTVLTARADRAAARSGQAYDSAVVRFVDTAGGCLALRTSWGTRIAAACPGRS